MKMFIENCANSYNATLGHNWFLNIANYLYERKNMNIKIRTAEIKSAVRFVFYTYIVIFFFL